jgi:hypothetical protein
MTKEEAIKHREVILAFMDGKEIQWRTIGTTSWHNIINPAFALDREYRIKPAPAYRPWRVEEVPVGKLARYKTDPQFRYLIGGVYRHEPEVHVQVGASRHDSDFMLLSMEASLDDGKTWQPCGVME